MINCLLFFVGISFKRHSLPQLKLQVDSCYCILRSTYITHNYNHEIMAIVSIRVLQWTPYDRDDQIYHPVETNTNTI